MGRLKGLCGRCSRGDETRSLAKNLIRDPTAGQSRERRRVARHG